MADPVVVPAGAPAAQPVASVPAPIVRAEALKPEVVESAEEALKKRVMAITPHDLVPVAERAILEGQTFEQCRATILAEFTKGKTTPVGSTEPSRTPAAGEKPAVKVADVSGETLVRSLLG